MASFALPDSRTLRETISRGIVSSSDPAVLESSDKKSLDVSIPSIGEWNVMLGVAYNSIRNFFGTSDPNILSIRLSTTMYSPVKMMVKEVIELSTTWSPYASPDEIAVLSDLAKNGLHEVADRLNELTEVYTKDPDVGSLNLNSFRSVARFFMQNRNLSPDIVAGWDGHLSVDWRLPPADSRHKKQVGEGILWLEFLPDGQIEYVGFIKEAFDSPKIELKDVARHDDIISKISPFLKRMP